MSRGIQRERAVRAWYADRDWLAFRAPASLGVADVIAMRALHPGSGPVWRSDVHLVEVKSTAAGPYHGFGPADRKRLSDAARMAGAHAFLAWWPPHGKLRFIPEAEWPAPRVSVAVNPTTEARERANRAPGKAPGAPCGEE